MDRREALKIILSLFGGAVFGAHRLLANAVQGSDASLEFSSADYALLEEMAETIIPATPDCGGAKAAAVVPFMQEIVREFYSEQERQTFTAGLAMLQSDLRSAYSGRSFADLNFGERQAWVLSLERHAPPLPHYQMIKQLTVWGYFSSEIGATQALAHVSVPGRFEGCVTVGPGTRGWSE
jgi:hypothetical protein